LAPYGFWGTLCVVAGILSLRQTPWSFAAASTVFVWLFIVPCADIANAAVPWLVSDAGTDFRQALGPVRPSYGTSGLVLGAGLTLLGFLIQKGLYRSNALGASGYGVLAGLAALTILSATVGSF